MADEIIPTPETPAEPEVNQLELLGQYKETMEAMSRQIESLHEEITSLKPVPQTEEIDPNTDPENFAPPTWKDLRSEVDTRAQKVVQATLEQIESERQRMVKEEQEAQEAADRLFDEKVTDLEKQGFLSPMKDINDPNDQGRFDRAQLFGLAAHLETNNLDQVAKSLKSMKDAGMTFDVKAGEFVKTNANPAPPKAPVGSSSRSTPGNPGLGITPTEFHTTPLRTLIKKYPR